MCDTIKQVQKAGDNSQQIQAQNITIINGIDEKRAREICDEKFQLIRNEFSQEAFQLANERVSKFEDILIPKMKQIQGALECFADPSFQYLISKAHRTAACSDKVSDYELLSELLIHRTQKKNSRNDIAGINRAVEIIDQITDDSLNALTLFFTIQQFSPISKKLSEGLEMLNNLYGKLPDFNYQNKEWIEELDILDAVRYSTLTSLKKMEDYWSGIYNGFVTVGIKKDSENYKKAINILNENLLSENVLIENELLKDYYIIPVRNIDEIDSLRLVQTVDIYTKRLVPLTIKQQEVLKQIWDMYEKNPTLIQKVKNDFNSTLEKYENIKKTKDFWNSIPYAINITSVGRVLAHINAKRYDQSLPDLNV